MIKNANIEESPLLTMHERVFPRFESSSRQYALPRVTGLGHSDTLDLVLTTFNAKTALKELQVCVSRSENMIAVTSLDESSSEVNTRFLWAIS